jgi:hypothetical protein
MSSLGGGSPAGLGRGMSLDAMSRERRIAELKRAAADHALARDGGTRREATVQVLRSLWEIAAADGAPIEALAVVNKLIQALEALNTGATPALLQASGPNNGEPPRLAGAGADMALAAALVDALNEYERMPIQEAVDYVAAKRGLRAATLKSIRQKLKSKNSKDPASQHYHTALETIAAQADPIRAIRAQLMK